MDAKEDSPQRHRDHGARLTGEVLKDFWLCRRGQLFASIRGLPLICVNLRSSAVKVFLRVYSWSVFRKSPTGSARSRQQLVPVVCMVLIDTGWSSRWVGQEIQEVPESVIVCL